MGNRRFEMYEYRQVLVRLRQGDSDRAIARSKLMGRCKVREVRGVAEAQGWLERDHPLPEDAVLAKVFTSPGRASTPSLVEPFGEKVTVWSRRGLDGTTIHRLLRRRYSFTGSYSSVRRYLEKLCPEASGATMRLEFSPGEAAQVDFGSGPKVPDPVTGELRSTWFFVMTLCWSRHQYAEVVWDQKVSTWLGCHQRAFRFFGGVPRRMVIDSAKCAITRACSREPEVQRSYAELAEAYGFKIDPCPPRQPQKKGRVEAGVKYIKRGFLPERMFRGLADANRQLESWVLGEAGNRIHGTTRERPLTRFAEVEKHELQALPDRAFEPCEWHRLRLHSDGHIRLDHGFYSAPFTHIGKLLWVRATATMVQAFDGHELVASHCRLTRPGESSTVVDHLSPQARAHLRQTPAWCEEQAERIGPACRELVGHLFAERIVDHLRAARSLIGLQAKFGRRRLEAACGRALAYATPQYRAVKTILDRGLDQQPTEGETVPALSPVYTGGAYYSRDPGKLLAN